MEFMIGGGVVLGITLLLLLVWRFQRPATAYGSAHWLTIFTAFARGLFKPRGLIVGDFTGLLPVYYDGTHAITYGAAGSGKGTTVIIPNLLHSRYIFLNDPGGENTAVAIRQWRARGFEIYVINPFGLHAGKPWALPHHAFNPFDSLDPQSDTFASDAKVCAEILTPRTGRESGSVKYFTEHAQSWKQASIIHIKTTEPPHRQNLGTVYQHAHLDARDWGALLKAMKANPACEGLVRAAAIDMERLEAEAPEHFNAVFSTVQQNLDWLGDPKARAAISRSEIDFEALKGLKPGARGAVIAVVMPLRYKETHKAIPRLALQCALWAMQREPLAARKVLFEIDEAASLGRLEHLPQWLAELRKYRVQWSLHFQNVGQPKHLYEREWQTFQGNAGLKRFIGIRDPETAREAVAYCGVCTITVQSKSSNGGSTSSLAGRELRKPDEFLHLPDHQMIALIENLHPALLRKTPYWQRPEFAGRYHRNPFRENTNHLPLGTSFKVLWGRIAYCAAWWLTPHPLAACIITAAVTLVTLSFMGEAPW